MMGVQDSGRALLCPSTAPRWRNTLFEDIDQSNTFPRFEPIAGRGTSLDGGRANRFVEPDLRDCVLQQALAALFMLFVPVMGLWTQHIRASWPGAEPACVDFVKPGDPGGLKTGIPRPTFYTEEHSLEKMEKREGAPPFLFFFGGPGLGGVPWARLRTATTHENSSSQ